MLWKICLWYLLETSSNPMKDFLKAFRSVSVPKYTIQVDFEIKHSSRYSGDLRYNYEDSSYIIKELEKIMKEPLKFLKDPVHSNFALKVLKYPTYTLYVDYSEGYTKIEKNSKEGSIKISKITFYDFKLDLEKNRGKNL